MLENISSQSLYQKWEVPLDFVSFLGTELFSLMAREVEIMHPTALGSLVAAAGHAGAISLTKKALQTDRKDSPLFQIGAVIAGLAISTLALLYLVSQCVIQSTMRLNLETAMRTACFGLALKTTSYGLYRVGAHTLDRFYWYIPTKMEDLKSLKPTQLAHVQAYFHSHSDKRTRLPLRLQFALGLPVGICSGIGEGWTQQELIDLRLENLSPLTKNQKRELNTLFLKHHVSPQMRDYTAEEIPALPPITEGLSPETLEWIHLALRLSHRPIDPKLPEQFYANELPPVCDETCNFTFPKDPKPYHYAWMRNHYAVHRSEWKALDLTEQRQFNEKCTKPLPLFSNDARFSKKELKQIAQAFQADETWLDDYPLQLRRRLADQFEAVHLDQSPLFKDGESRVPSLLGRVTEVITNQKVLAVALIALTVAASTLIAPQEKSKPRDIIGSFNSMEKRLTQKNLTLFTGGRCPELFFFEKGNETHVPFVREREEEMLHLPCPDQNCLTIPLRSRAIETIDTSGLKRDQNVFFEFSNGSHVPLIVEDEECEIIDLSRKVDRCPDRNCLVVPPGSRAVEKIDISGLKRERDVFFEPSDEPLIVEEEECETIHLSRKVQDQEAKETDHSVRKTVSDTYSVKSYLIGLCLIVSSLFAALFWRRKSSRLEETRVVLHDPLTLDLSNAKQMALRVVEERGGEQRFWVDLSQAREELLALARDVQVPRRIGYGGNGIRAVEVALLNGPQVKRYQLNPRNPYIQAFLERVAEVRAASSSSSSNPPPPALTYVEEERSMASSSSAGPNTVLLRHSPEKVASSWWSFFGENEHPAKMKKYQVVLDEYIRILGGDLETYIQTVKDLVRTYPQHQMYRDLDRTLEILTHPEDPKPPQRSSYWSLFAQKEYRNAREQRYAYVQALRRVIESREYQFARRLSQPSKDQAACLNIVERLSDVIFRPEIFSYMDEMVHLFTQTEPGRPFGVNWGNVDGMILAANNFVKAADKGVYGKSALALNKQKLEGATGLKDFIGTENTPHLRNQMIFSHLNGERRVIDFCRHGCPVTSGSLARTGTCLVSRWATHATGYDVAVSSGETIAPEYEVMLDSMARRGAGDLYVNHQRRELNIGENERDRVLAVEGLQLRHPNEHVLSQSVEGTLFKREKRHANITTFAELKHAIIQTFKEQDDASHGFYAQNMLPRIVKGQQEYLDTLPKILDMIHHHFFDRREQIAFEGKDPLDSSQSFLLGEWQSFIELFYAFQKIHMLFFLSQTPGSDGNIYIIERIKTICKDFLDRGADEAAILDILLYVLIGLVSVDQLEETLVNLIGPPILVKKKEVLFHRIRPLLEVIKLLRTIPLETFEAVQQQFRELLGGWMIERIHVEKRPC